MAPDVEQPPLTAIADALAGLDTSSASRRRQCMEQLERWAEAGLPEGAGQLVLEHATRSFPSTDNYPNAPNEQLIRLLWNRKTRVAGEDVEAVFFLFDDACRASAIRLLAELDTPAASLSLARVLEKCRNGTLPNVTWPYLLPLERKPRDPDVLVPALIALAAETEGGSPVDSVLQAYLNAGTLDPEHRRLCAEALHRGRNAP